MTLPGFNAEASLGPPTHQYHAPYRYGQHGLAQRGVPAYLLPDGLGADDDVGALDILGLVAGSADDSVGDLAGLDATGLAPDGYDDGLDDTEGDELQDEVEG